VRRRCGSSDEQAGQLWSFAVDLGNPQLSLPFRVMERVEAETSCQVEAHGELWRKRSLGVSVAKACP
jgi:hypothetical protein